MYQSHLSDTRDIELFYTMDVNLNLYKYFLAVMKTRSVSSAAKMLSVSQPTVSYSIHALQRELGETLFTLGKYGLKPTQHAVNLYQKLHPIYNQLIQVIFRFVNEVN